ncbi:hypothetical protein ScPMuIL_010501 [Solemya velum]
MLTQLKMHIRAIETWKADWIVLSVATSWPCKCRVTFSHILTSRGRLAMGWVERTLLGTCGVSMGCYHRFSAPSYTDTEARNTANYCRATTKRTVINERACPSLAESSGKRQMFMWVVLFLIERRLRNMNQMKRRKDGQGKENIQPITSSPYKKWKVLEEPALKPDEIYPQKCIQKNKDQKVIQNHGQLKLSIYVNYGLLTIHVMQARHLTSGSKNQCDSFVKLSLVSDDTKRSRCQTGLVPGTNNPLFDEKFSFELLEEDQNKRLLVSIWNGAHSKSCEFLGCMSFGVKHLTDPTKDVSGWYYLLTEDIGRRKHLRVCSKQKPGLQVRNTDQNNIPIINKDIGKTETRTLMIPRGKQGFGFTVLESWPVKVGRIDGVSPAEEAGLQPGDCIIRVNSLNVSRSTAPSVAKLVRHSGKKLVLEIQRNKQVSIEKLDKSPWRPTCARDEESSDDDVVMDELNDTELSVDDTEFGYPLFPSYLPTSTPLPMMCNAQTTMKQNNISKCHNFSIRIFIIMACTAMPSDRRKQEAIHSLLSMELDYIDVMYSGLQQFYRPLRHFLLTPEQHTALFQNLEKLVMISEYLVRQMQDNIPSMTSSSDTDTSVNDGRQFINSVGFIYQSKVQMLCHAYESYAKGSRDALRLLSELNKSPEFVKFTRNLSGDDFDITTFIQTPLKYIQELSKLVSQVSKHTSINSEDHLVLEQLADVLKMCSKKVSKYNVLTPHTKAQSNIKARTSSGSSLNSVGSSESAQRINTNFYYMQTL